MYGISPCSPTLPIDLDFICSVPSIDEAQIESTWKGERLISIFLRHQGALSFSPDPTMACKVSIYFGNRGYRPCLHEQPTSLLTSLLKNLSGWSVATRKLATFYRVSTRIFVSLLTSLLVVWGHENPYGPNHFLLERAICTAKQH